MYLSTYYVRVCMFLCIPLVCLCVHVVFLFVCTVHVCHVCLFVCMYLCVHVVFTCTYVCTQMCVQVYVCACVRVCVFVCVCRFAATLSSHVLVASEESADHI